MNFTDVIWKFEVAAQWTDSMPENLATEMATYEQHRQELLGNAENKYVLIQGSDVLGTYETESDAINEGYRKLGNVPFLVKRIIPVERPLNFLSGLVRL